jgi:putative two-component system response regulator
VNLEPITKTEPSEVDCSAVDEAWDELGLMLDAAMSAERISPALQVDVASARIMIVDDEPLNFKVVRAQLREAGYQNFITTSDSTQAVALVRESKPDVLLLDMMMPHVSGLQILQTLRADSELASLPVIVLTATDDRNLKRTALELGTTDFLHKPVDPIDLVPRVRNALAMKAHQAHLENYARDLEREVRNRTAELESLRLEMIHCLGRAAEYRDNETGRHVVRVGRYVQVIAEALGLDDDTVELLAQAAPLHDMGKIGIPDSVLLKPGRLDAEEFAVMRRHTEYGRKIVSTVENDAWTNLAENVGQSFVGRMESPVLRMAASIAATHHEKWDGTGYPLGLKGEEIPLEGRITAVADVFDALSTKRPYKPAFPLQECFRIMADERGGHFDPHILDAFFARRPAIVRIKMALADDD